MRLPYLLCALLALPADAQVRVQGAPEVVPAVGGQAGAASSINQTALAPSAVPTLALPVQPNLALPTAKPGAVQAVASVQPAKAVLAAPQAAVANPALPASAAAPKADPYAVGPLQPSEMPGPNGEPSPRERVMAGKTHVGPGSEIGPDRSLDFERVNFDGAAKRAAPEVTPTLWSRVRSFLGTSDLAPSFPPKPDEKVRVGGKTYKIGRQLASGPDWSLHEPAGLGRSEEAILVFSPDAKAAFEKEKNALESLDKTDVPHPKLKAAGNGVLVLVQRNLDGWDTMGLLAKGLSHSQWNGLADLTANLIRAGAVADLSPKNLIWEHWRGWWALKSGKGWRAAGVPEVFDQVLALQGAIPNRAAFLSALRGRLGPDSAEWRRVVAAAEVRPDIRDGLAALAKRDAARPPPQPLRFGAAARKPAFDDSVVSPGELTKRLGYSPASVKERWALHADDPGKLNTSVAMLEPKGKMKAVFKGADAHIIKNEVFVRKVVRAFFGEYFETPGSLAVLNGYDSYMVMEPAGGGKSYTGPKLTREQRAALGLLVHTFGLGDMNQGNVFYGEPTWLIDFEQALSRHGPVANRIPDEGILLEMPWVNAKEPPPIEDFLPAVGQWRAFFQKPETQAQVAAMLKATGYTAEEQTYALSAFRANVAQLEWTLQADVDFADGLRRR
ncbi:hypothetical protein EPO15_14330 [bacterium]|nr:MAG: hypothetical protein EPO15_14330 [bacterium]